MANLIDYLAWRGDVPLEVSPWNELDSLVAAVLSYLDFHGLEDARGWTLREAKRIDLLIPKEASTFLNRKKLGAVFTCCAVKPSYRCGVITGIKANNAH